MLLVAVKIHLQKTSHIICTYVLHTDPTFRRYVRLTYWFCEVIQMYNKHIMCFLNYTFECWFADGGPRHALRWGHHTIHAHFVSLMSWDDVKLRRIALSNVGYILYFILTLYALLWLTESCKILYFTLCFNNSGTKINSQEISRLMPYHYITTTREAE